MAKEAYFTNQAKRAAEEHVERLVRVESLFQREREEERGGVLEKIREGIGLIGASSEQLRDESVKEWGRLGEKEREALRKEFGRGKGRQIIDQIAREWNAFGGPGHKESGSIGFEGGSRVSRVSALADVRVRQRRITEREHALRTGLSNDLAKGKTKSVADQLSRDRLSMSREEGADHKLRQELVEGWRGLSDKEKRMAIARTRTAGGAAYLRDLQSVQNEIERRKNLGVGGESLPSVGFGGKDLSEEKYFEGVAESEGQVAEHEADTPAGFGKRDIYEETQGSLNRLRRLKELNEKRNAITDEIVEIKTRDPGSAESLPGLYDEVTAIGREISGLEDRPNTDVERQENKKIAGLASRFERESRGESLGFALFLQSHGLDEESVREVMKRAEIGQRQIEREKRSWGQGFALGDENEYSGPVKTSNLSQSQNRDAAPAITD